MSLSEKMQEAIHKTMWYTIEDMQGFPTISQGHMDDLKVELWVYGVKVRIWLSRMTVEDGMPYNNQVTVEYLDADDWCWRVFDKYEPPTELDPNI